LVGIGQKLFSKMTTKAGYQEIFAEFIVGTEQSPAQWYSLKPLPKGIPSLADLLEVSAENLQTLLSKAGLRKLRQRDKLFSFQSSKFESFRSQFMIQEACETTRRRVKGLNSKQWFLRLGTQYYGELCNPGTNGHPPRVQNIRSLRKEFKDTISGFASAQPQTQLASWPPQEATECDTERRIFMKATWFSSEFSGCSFPYY
jgi:hypothetical protein